MALQSPTARRRAPRRDPIPSRRRGGSTRSPTPPSSRSQMGGPPRPRQRIGDFFGHPRILGLEPFRATYARIPPRSAALRQQSRLHRDGSPNDRARYWSRHSGLHAGRFDPFKAAYVSRQRSAGCRLGAHPLPVARSDGTQPPSRRFLEQTVLFLYRLGSSSAFLNRPYARCRTPQSRRCLGGHAQPLRCPRSRPALRPHLPRRGCRPRP